MKEIFLQIGKDEKEVVKTMKNKEFSKLWYEIVMLSEVQLPWDKNVGNLLFELSNKSDPHVIANKKLIASYIGN